MKMRVPFTLKIFFLNCILFTSFAKIIVKGNLRVNSEKIKLLIRDFRDPELINSVLFNTGLFKEVRSDIQGEDIIIEIKEKPVVASVAFVVDGKTRKKGDMLGDFKNLALSTEVITGNVVDAQIIEHAKSRLVEYYARTGYENISVREEIIEKESGACELRFHIKRGPKLKLDEIIFIGAPNLNHSTMRSLLSRREITYFLVYPTSTAEPYALVQDYEKIIAYAREEGFLNAKIKTSFTETSGNKQKIYVVMEEGPRFKLGTIEITNQDTAPMSVKQNLKTGQLLRSYNIESYSAYIERKYREAGFRVKVIVEEKPNGDVMDLEFVVVPASNAVISKIEITGNRLTRDSVLRRNLSLAEGDYYDDISVKRAKNQLLSTGFFSEVEITPERDETGDIIHVHVKENKLGQLGLNFSTTFGGNATRMLNFYYAHPNFLGKQHNFAIDLTLGNVSKSFSLSYGVPTLFGRNVAFSGDVYRTSVGSQEYEYLPLSGLQNADKNGKLSNMAGFIDPQRRADARVTPRPNPDPVVAAIKKVSHESVVYSIGKLGFSCGPAFTLYKYGILSLRFKFESQTFRSDEKTDTKIRFFQQTMFPKERIIPQLEANWRLARVDDSNEPRKGWAITENLRLGMGGKFNFLKSVTSLEHYHPLNRFKTFYVTSLLNFGTMRSVGGGKTWIDNYQHTDMFIGGFRKFGPAERNRYTPIGGKRFVNASMELNAPSPLPPAWGVRLFAGVQAGSLWKTALSPGTVLDDPYAIARLWKNNVPDIASDKFKWRASASAGIRWQLGPVKLEWYWSKIIKKDYETDRTAKFTFNIGM